LAIRFDGDEPNSEPRTSHHRQAFSHKVSENNYCQFRGNLRFFVEKTSQEVFEMGIIPEVSRIHRLLSSNMAGKSPIEVLDCRWKPPLAGLGILQLAMMTGYIP